MRQRVVAGAEFSFTSPEETRTIIRSELRDPLAQLAHLTQGPTYVPVRASAVHLDPGASAEITGPRAGYLWSLLRVSVVGPPVAVHIGDAAASTYLATVGGEPGGWAVFPRGAAIVPPGALVHIRNPHDHAVVINVNLGVAVVPVELQSRL